MIKIGKKYYKLGEWYPRFAYLPTNIGYDEDNKIISTWWNWYEERATVSEGLYERRKNNVTTSNYYNSVSTD